jgi:hypothetical protein
MTEQLTVEGDAPLTLSSDQYVIGRGENCDVLLPETDGGASRRHALLEKDENGNWHVTDLKSRNGTRVNGEKIAGRRRLENGDVLGVGESRIFLSLAAKPSPLALSPDPLSQRSAVTAEEPSPLPESPSLEAALDRSPPFPRMTPGTVSPPAEAPRDAEGGTEAITCPKCGIRYAPIWPECPNCLGAPPKAEGEMRQGAPADPPDARPPVAATPESFPSARKEPSPALSGETVRSASTEEKPFSAGAAFPLKTVIGIGGGGMLLSLFLPWLKAPTFMGGEVGVSYVGFCSELFKELGRNSTGAGPQVLLLLLPAFAVLIVLGSLSFSEEQENFTAPLAIGGSAVGLLFSLCLYMEAASGVSFGGVAIDLSGFLGIGVAFFVLCSCVILGRAIYSLKELSQNKGHSRG